MELHFFLGAHATVHKHILGLGQSIQEPLAEAGIKIVALEHTVDTLQNNAGSKDPLDALLEGAKGIKRLVILAPNAIGTVTRPAGGALLYPRMKSALGKLLTLLRNRKVRIFFATRNPADFFPAAYSEALTHAQIESFEEFTKDISIPELRWSDTLDRVAQVMTNPSLAGENTAGIFVFRYEDYAQYWRTVFYAMTGYEEAENLPNSFAPEELRLSLYGARLMYKYIRKHKPAAIGDFSRIRNEFHEKFPHHTTQIEDSFWNDDLIEDLGDRYADDWYLISRDPRLTILQPTAGLPPIIDK